MVASNTFRLRGTRPVRPLTLSEELFLRDSLRAMRDPRFTPSTIDALDEAGFDVSDEQPTQWELTLASIH